MLAESNVDFGLSASEMHLWRNANFGREQGEEEGMEQEQEQEEEEEMEGTGQHADLVPTGTDAIIRGATVVAWYSRLAESRNNVCWGVLAVGTSPTATDTHVSGSRLRPSKPRHDALTEKFVTTSSA